MGLHKLTREALEWRSGICGEQASGDDDVELWEEAASDCDAALADDSLLHHDAAVGELLNFLGCGPTRAEEKAINADLARAGRLDRFDPQAQYLGGKPRTITVDGVTYERA